MECHKIQRELSAYLDQEVPSFTKKKIEKHLDGCYECRLKYEELSALVGNLNNYQSIGLSNDFTDKVICKIEEENAIYNLSLEDWLSSLFVNNKLITIAMLIISFLGAISLAFIANELQLFTLGTILYHLFSSSYFVSDKLIQLYPELMLYLQSALVVSILGFIVVIQRFKKRDDS